MKNCDEMVNSLFERREQYHNEKKRQTKRIAHVATSLCCVCVIAFVGFGLRQGGMFSKAPLMLNYDGNGQTPGEQSGQQTEQTTGSDPITGDISTGYLFTINEITGISSPAPLYRDPETHYSETWDYDKAVKYLGIDIPELVISCNKKLEYIVNDQFTVLYENTGNLVEDRLFFSFAGKDNEKLTVLASRLRPPYDCIYYSETENITSIRIPETGEKFEVYVYAQNKSETLLEYDFYVIEFEYSDIHYRLIAENIRSYQLETIVKEIMKK